MKRARLLDAWVPNRWDASDAQSDVNPELILDRMGKRLHDYLLQLKIMGKLTSTHVTTIAYLHQSSGGRGCSGLNIPALKELNSLSPDLKNASRIL